MRAPTFNRNPQRRSLPQDVLLSHKLVQRARTHPNRQRRIASYLIQAGVFVAFEQPVGHYG